MEAFASPNELADKFCISDESDGGDGEEEEEEEGNVWMLQPEVLDTPESMTDERCPTFEPSRRIYMDRVIEATCCGFSMDGNWLAVGTRHGPIQIYCVGDGRLAFTLDVLKGGLKRWPCTDLCIRPSTPGDSSYNVLLSCDLSGQVHYWHMTSGMHLGLSKEQGNSIYTVDFHPAGVKYVTSGSDCKVRVYDASTCTLSQTLNGGYVFHSCSAKERNGITTAGHSNRVFAVKWHPMDVHVALSGGWDNTIQIWDLRAGHSVRSIYGPKVCGDTIDVRDAGDVILSGSWRGSKQLQEWDFGTGKLLRDVLWPTSKEQPCRVYAATYGRGVSRNLFVAGGSGSNETCIFSVNTGQMVARLPDDEQATYSLSVSMDGSHLAATTGKTVSIIDLKAELSRSQEPEPQFKMVTSSPRTSKHSSKIRDSEKEGESKRKVQQMDARLFKHSGAVTPSNKIRLPDRSIRMTQEAKVPRSSAVDVSKPDVKRHHITRPRSSTST